jgi:hypothetical protein
MQDDDKLFIEKDKNGEIFLPKIKENYKTFLNKSINLYGSSNSQKSTLIIQIMKALKDYVPACICFNMTENSNNTFKKLLPDALIHTILDIPTLESIWRRQEILTEIHKKVNNIDNIKEVIAYFDESSFNDNIEKIYKKKEIELDNLHNRKLDNNLLVLEKSKLNEKFNEIENILTKKYLNNIKDKIKNISNNLKNNNMLTKEEERYYSKYKNLDDDRKIIIKYNNINPNLLIIFDDCASSIKPITKSEVIRKLFYQGRHNNITFICTAQDEIDLDASLRKNARITILCDSNCAAGFFERSSNGFGKPIKLLVRKIIPILFSQENKYKKLIYNKDSINLLEWTIATVIEPFQFCSDNILKFIDSVSKNEDKSLSKLIQKI